MPRTRTVPIVATLRSTLAVTRAVTRAVTLAATFALAGAAAAQNPRTARDTTPVMTSSPLPTGRVTYRTLVETNLEMEQLAARYPDRVRRFALPHRTVAGQVVWALEITRGVAEPDGKPVFVMTGLHHAREWPTVDLTMEFVHDILMNDGQDPRITRLMDEVRFIAVPVVNPDGYELSRTLLNEQKRKSCRVEPGRDATLAECANPRYRNAGVDLNRNYGAFWGGIGANIGAGEGSFRGAAPFSEPEIRNMRDLFNAHQVVVALSNHTPDAKVLRAPSSPDEPTPADVEAYDALGQLLGGDLRWDAGPWTRIYYAASGTMEEYAYYSAGTFAYTGGGFSASMEVRVVDADTGDAIRCALVGEAATRTPRTEFEAAWLEFDGDWILIGRRSPQGSALPTLVVRPDGTVEQLEFAGRARFWMAR